MANSQIINEIIELLERQRLQGDCYAEISSDNLKFLFGGIKQTSVDPRKTDPQPAKAFANREDRTSLTERTNLGPKNPNFKKCSEGNSSPTIPINQPLSELSSSEMDVSIGELKELVSQCKRCRLSKGRKQTVFGCGPKNAHLMFIGDRPTQVDDNNGIPFSDKSGELLDKIIKAMQLSRDRVYLTNIVKCCPPDRRLPEDDEAFTCLPYLQREIELVKPEVIVLFGAVPLKFLLNKKGIAEHRGRWFRYNNIDCLATYHPSFLLRVPKAKREVWDDMKAVMKRLNISERVLK